jgi:hypothetical protein
VKSIVASADEVRDVPRLIKVWPEWGHSNGMTRHQAYATADSMPVGVKVKIGGRLRLNADKLAAYLEAGGDLAQKAV